MRQDPSQEGPPKTKMKREEALALAKANPASWTELQVFTLESYLIEVAKKKPPSKRNAFMAELDKLAGRDLEALEDLIALGKDHKILPDDYNIEKERLNVFCGRRNIEITSN